MIIFIDEETVTVEDLQNDMEDEENDGEDESI